MFSEPKYTKRWWILLMTNVVTCSCGLGVMGSLPWVAQQEMPSKAGTLVFVATLGALLFGIGAHQLRRLVSSS